jgi:hypothetical protein
MFKRIFILFSAAVLASCSTETPKETTSTSTIPTATVAPKPRVIPPDFNADSAFAYVKAQADMGPRTPGSKAHDKCVAYYQAFFKKMGADVKVQGGSATTYDGKPWRIDNVIASFNPSAKNRILLAAHYDSRPIAEKDPVAENKNKPTPGVNDGASGAGVLMEIARAIKEKSPAVGIDIIMLDLEDYGDNGGDPKTWCLGSQYWARNPHKTGYKARYGILLDMVGAKNARFPKEGTSVFYAGDVLNKVWGAANLLGYNNYFIDEKVGELTDDHVFINELAQIPCIDIIHYEQKGQYGEFFEHHHTTKDDLSNIDKNTLKAVGQTLLEVIYNED